jgi:hypothetical protein
MAPLGQAVSHEPQSMRPSGSMDNLRSSPGAAAMQSRGQTATHVWSDWSMHGAAMTQAMVEEPSRWIDEGCEAGAAPMGFARRRHVRPIEVPLDGPVVR